MKVFGKYQMYYGKIKTNVIKIQEEYGYTNLSKAFAHWYLEKIYNLDVQQLAESIIDGDGDNGIDAIMVEEGTKTMFLYQFKFPDKESNVDKAIDEKTVLKIFNGYKKLVSKRKPNKANENFLRYRDIVKEECIYNYKLIFVVFHNGLSEPAKDALETNIYEIEEITGNEISTDFIIHKKLCDMYDRLQKKDRLNIELEYKKFDTSYNLGEEVKSYVGFANAIDIINSCEEHMDIIFDENIRLYEGDNNVNTGIYSTATTDESKNFFFYHNGIVLICDKCKNSTGNQMLLLEGASVVNGCQTINSLKRAFDDDKIKEDIFIQFRIIETSDFDLRANITEYLNSQTKIKDSYFLANDPFVRELQSELLSKGYFLERLAHEYSYKRELNKVDEFEKKKILVLEKAIQIYSVYFHNEYAARAKRGKNELFDKKVIENIISAINADKVIMAFEWYDKVSKIITLYRKCKRSSTINMAFFEFMDIDIVEENYFDEMQKYSFLNTGDMLVLNAVANLINNVSYGDDEEYIIDAIMICKYAVELCGLLPYQATKANTVFEAIQKEIVAESAYCV